jgi:hypothetical protein
MCLRVPSNSEFRSKYNSNVTIAFLIQNKDDYNLSMFQLLRYLHHFHG